IHRDARRYPREPESRPEVKWWKNINSFAGLVVRRKRWRSQSERAAPRPPPGRRRVPTVGAPGKFASAVASEGRRRRNSPSHPRTRTRRRTSGHGGAGTTGGSTGDVGPPVRARVLPCAASEMGAAVTGLRSVAEAVADSAHRLDVLPGGAELLAEPLHMGVDGARRDVSVHAPDVLQEGGSRLDPVPSL